MKFSLIAVTTNRLYLVERLFRSLEAQTYREFEVLFVHGPACPDGAQALIGKFPTLDVKLFVSSDHCLSRSRNLALPHATGDVIAFPDDDCLYAPDTLARCAEIFIRHPQPDVVLARTADLDEIILNPVSRLKLCANRYALFRHSVSYAQFHKHEVVRVTGRFDENMGVGCSTPYQSGEDTDYVLRACTAGFRICSAPAVIVRHPAVNLRDPALREKTRTYAKGRMYLLRKHKMPLWFVLANIAYPLLSIPKDCLRECLKVCTPVFRYRWAMFAARLAAYASGGVKA